MSLIALGQAHGSQFAPLVGRAPRARGSVMCVGGRDAEKGPSTKCVRRVCNKMERAELASA